MQYLIEFEHDSKHLGHNGYGQLLIKADSFESACEKVTTFSVKLRNSVTGFTWNEGFSNPTNFVNLTI